MAELPNVKTNLPEPQHWSHTFTTDEINRSDFGVEPQPIAVPKWSDLPQYGAVTDNTNPVGEGAPLPGWDIGPDYLPPNQPTLGANLMGRSLAPIMAWLLPALGVRGELVQLILAALSGEHSPEIIADYLTDWGREDDAAAVRAAIPKSEGN